MLNFKTIGKLHIKYDAVPKDDGYDDSLDCTFTLNNDTGDFEIEDFYRCCRNFAAAMGFTEETINNWFGEY